MDRLLARLELKLGRFAIHNFTTYLVGAMAFAFVIGMFRPEALGMFVLDPRTVQHAPWTLVTFLAYPGSSSVIFILFVLMFTHFIGTSLEANWGAFKYNVYFLVGWLATVAASFLTGYPATNVFLLQSLLFAVATLAPDHQILMIFFPIKLKWIGLLWSAFLAFQFINGGFGVRVAIGASVLNYFLFLSGHLLDLFRGRRLQVRQAARRTSFSPPPVARAKDATGRACAICGAKQDDGADIRVCSCDKCGGKARDLCLEHARSH